MFFPFLLFTFYVLYNRKLIGAANILNLTKKDLDDCTALGHYFRIISTTTTKGLLTGPVSSTYQQLPLV